MLPIVQDPIQAEHCLDWICQLLDVSETLIPSMESALDRELPPSTQSGQFTFLSGLHPPSPVRIKGQRSRRHCSPTAGNQPVGSQLLQQPSASPRHGHIHSTENTEARLPAWLPGVRARQVLHASSHHSPTFSTVIPFCRWRNWVCRVWIICSRSLRCLNSGLETRRVENTPCHSQSSLSSLGWNKAPGSEGSRRSRDHSGHWAQHPCSCVVLDIWS